MIKAHAALTGGKRGRPTGGQGAALTRAGIVLLAGVVEQYVEGLFEEAVDALWLGMSARQRTQLLENTSHRFRNADVFKTEMLFLNLGLPWVLTTIRWQKFSNATFKNSLNGLIQARNQIAHGARPGLHLAALVRWRRMVDAYAPHLEAIVCEHIYKISRKRPGWC